MKGLRDTQCIVTGAARGIGFATAVRLAHEGAQVVGVDRDRPEDALPDGVQFVELDVSVADAVARFFAERRADLHVLVNNAADIDDVDIFSDDVQLWSRMLQNNLTSMWHMTHHASVLMRRAGRGAIVNIASTDALVGHMRRTGYAASKGGVIALTHTVAKQLAPYGVRVNCVIPGAVRTRLTPDAEPDTVRHRLIPRLGQPEEIASAIAFLASDEASYMTGQCVRVDGGQHRLP